MWNGIKKEYFCNEYNKNGFCYFGELKFEGEYLNGKIWKGK